MSFDFKTSFVIAMESLLMLLNKLKEDLDCLLESVSWVLTAFFNLY